MDYLLTPSEPIRIPQPIAEAMGVRCKETGLTPSELLAEAIAHYLGFSPVGDRPTLESLYRNSGDLPYT